MKTVFAIVFSGALIAAATAASLRVQATVSVGPDSMPVVIEVDRWTGAVSVCTWSVIRARTNALSKKEIDRQAWEQDEALREQAELERLPPDVRGSSKYATERYVERTKRRIAWQEAQEKEAKALPPVPEADPKYESKRCPRARLTK